MEQNIGRLNKVPYPTRRMQYCMTVGNLLVKTIYEILHDDFGYSAVHISPIQANNVDLLVHVDGKPFAILEVINWDWHSYMDPKRLDSIVRNLVQYNCHRFLVTSFKEVLTDTQLQLLAENNIIVIEIGFQLLPPSFYGWFKKHHGEGAIKDKKPSTKHTYNHIFRLLYPYFKTNKTLGLSNIEPQNLKAKITSNHPDKPYLYSYEHIHKQKEGD